MTGEYYYKFQESIFYFQTGRVRERWEADHSLLLAKILSSRNNMYHEEKVKTWNDVIRSCTEDRGHKKLLIDLEPVHIFCIANIIARPIVVLANALIPSSDISVVQGLRFEGIYLPLLRNLKECENSPIVLAFDSNHFVPLFSTEKLGMLTKSVKLSETAQHCVPLKRFDGSDIPVRYLIGQEINNHDLYKYLDICEIPFSLDNGPSPTVTMAFIHFKAPAAFSIELLWKFQGFVENQQRLAYNVTDHHMQQSQQQNHHQQQQRQQQQQQYIQRQQQQQEHYDSEYKAPQYALVRQINPTTQPTKLCKRSTIGKCDKFISPHNNQDLCDECYNQTMILQKQTRKRTPLPQQQQQQQQQQHQQQQIYAQQPAAFGVQQQRGYPHEKERQYAPIHQQDAFPKSQHHSLEDQHYSWDQLQYNKCTVCNKKACVKELDGMCKQCYSDCLFRSFEAKIKPEDQFQYQQTNKMTSFPLPTSQFSEFVCNYCGKKVMEPANEVGLCKACTKDQISDIQRNSLERKDQPISHQYGEASHPGRQVDEANKDLASGFIEYDKSKELCSHPGCIGSRTENSRECEVHAKKVEKKICAVCKENTVDENDVAACITCLQTQENLLNEVRKEQHRAKENNPQQFGGDNRHIHGRGPPGNNAPVGNGGLNHMDDVIQSLPPIPQNNSMANKHVPAHHASMPPTRFQPPNVYPGFQKWNSIDKNPPYRHDAPLNWQKPQQYGGGDVQENKGVMECINGDCKSFGRQENNYLCDKCFEEQLKNYPVSSKVIFLFVYFFSTKAISNFKN